MILKPRQQFSRWLNFRISAFHFKVVAVAGFVFMIGFVSDRLLHGGRYFDPVIISVERGWRWLDNHWKYEDEIAFRPSPQYVIPGVEPTALAYFGFNKIHEKGGIKIRLGPTFHLGQNTDLEQAAKLFALLDVLDLWPQVFPHLRWNKGKKEALELENIGNSARYLQHWGIKNLSGNAFFTGLLRKYGPYYADRFLFIFKERLNEFFVKELFANERFLRVYIESLDQFSHEDYLRTIFNPGDETFRGFLAFKVAADPYVNIDEELSELYQHTDILRRSYLYPKTHLHSYLQEFSNPIQLKILIRRPLPVEILYLEYNNRRLDLIEAPVVLKGKSFQQPMKPETVKFHGIGDLPKPTGIPVLTLHYRLQGTDYELTEKVQPFGYQTGAESDFIVSRLSSDEWSSFPGINIDEKNRIVTLNSTVRIDQNLKIPKGYIVKAGPGTMVELMGAASLISNSPVEFIGSKEHPITIKAVTGGQGFAVLNAGGKSSLENVMFKNLSEPQIGSWSLTGAATFYESPVEMRNVKFLDSRAEDGLNIIRGDFLLEQCVFQNSRSDALDVDFGKGKLLRVQFFESGNDAVDMSGSLVEIQELFVKGAGDKGISLGEKSKGYGGDIVIRETAVGIASKDLSQADFDKVKIEQSKIGLAAYQKKATFGPGSIRLKNFTSIDVENDWLIEERSTLKIDGDEIDGTEKKLAKKLY